MLMIKQHATGSNSIRGDAVNEKEKVTDQERLTLTVPEAGRLIGLARSASYSAAARGELPVLRFGRRLVVPIAALMRLLARDGPSSGSELTTEQGLQRSCVDHDREVETEVMRRIRHRDEK